MFYSHCCPFALCLLLRCHFAALGLSTFQTTDFATTVSDLAVLPPLCIAAEP